MRDIVIGSHATDLAYHLLEMLLVEGAKSPCGAITQLEHALQTADLAERCRAPDELIVAALLHDLGHLLDGSKTDAGEHRPDRHEDAGERWLSALFSRAVTEPVRLHVRAKRYLCVIEPTYLESLSPASLERLALQGGPLSRREAAIFEQTPWARDAVALRRWDDAANVPGLTVRGLAHHQRRIERLLDTQ